MADGNRCTVVARPNVFDGEVVCAEFQAGQTIEQMLGEGITLACEVTIGGDRVPRAIWPHVKPKAGQIVHVTIYPQGGGGGSKILRTIAMVAVAYLSYGVASGAIGGLTGGLAAAAGAGISIVGSLAINALIPPSTAAATPAAADPFNQLNSLTGTSNQVSPYGVIPCVVGTTQFFPPHAALPYTEISGDDQYLRMLLDLGYGDLDISDIQIGGTDIDTFDDVEYEIGTTPTLFSQDVFELTVETVMNTDGDTDTRSGQNPATEMSVDLIFPSGLFGVDANGKTVGAWVTVDIAFRQVGTSTWFGIYDQPGISISTSNATLDPVHNQIKVYCNERKVLRVGVRWKLPSSGQYEVKVTRLNHGWDAGLTWTWDMSWSVLRSFNTSAASTTGTTKLAVRIKATDQLNGVVSNLSVLASQKIPTYDPVAGTWSADAPTENPAWIYVWLLTRCPAVIRTLPDARIDLAGIAAWAAECAAKGYAIGFVMDSARALSDVCMDILSAGRASFGLRNGQYSAVRDVAQTVPVQMFTPKNSWDFSYSRTFSDLPHALRVTFTNPEANWQKDVVVVYWDGYNVGNATRFEELDLSMVTGPTAAWKLGRYHLSVMYNRPNTYQFTADVENIVCERGDLITVAHDIIGWGIAHGRVKSINGSQIVLDEVLELDPAKSYVIRVRRNDNTQLSSGATASYSWDSTYITFDNDTDIDSLVAPTRSFTIGSLAGVQAGDLYVVGEVARDVASMVVKLVEPASDLTATITVLDYSSAIINADAGTPPPFVSSITGQLWCSAPAIPQLNIRVSNSSPSDAGTVSNETGVSAGNASGIYRVPIWNYSHPAAIR